ncbi:MAG: hypothetical protein NTX88_05085 [Candidatus Atribacteria bacterium]|nr:hypothetical protein [Candidatus Atribacteria bacterium]
MTDPTCHISLNDSQQYQCTSGETLFEIARKAYPETYVSFMAARLNGEIVDLLTPVENDSEIHFIDFTNPEGRRTYLRSLLFLLSSSVFALFPEATLKILHSMSDGLYCEIHGIGSISTDHLDLIEKKMIEIREMNLPFEKETVSWEKAVNLFHAQKRTDLVRLFRYWRIPAIPLYRMNKYYDYYYGPLCPSTAYVRKFGFVLVPPGFFLQFPQNTEPDRLPTYTFRPKLFTAFQEAARWARIMEIENVGELNEAVALGQGREIISIAEALQEKRIAQIADLINERKGSLKLVLIAGPSSSGKTTFSRRLYIQLRVNGWNPLTVSLDDYFRSHQDIKKGDINSYERPEALDLELFEQQMEELIAGKEVEIPRYNFITGNREVQGVKTHLDHDGIIMVEGLHALNPLLSQDIIDEQKFKIYVSAITQLNIDNHNRISTTDCRLIRRLVRDSQFRGSTAVDVFKTWSMVLAGEEKYIFPFQEDADTMFNTSLLYELSILRQSAEPLLRAITPENEFYLEAFRLYTFLNHFIPLQSSFVPSNSILREFIGG